MTRNDNRSCSPKPAEPPAKRSRGEEQEQEQKEVKGEDVQTNKDQQKDLQTDKGEQKDVVQQAEEQKENQTDEVQEEEHKEIQKEGQPKKEVQGAEEQNGEQEEKQTDREEQKEEQKEAQGNDAVKNETPEVSNEKQEVSPLPLTLLSVHSTTGEFSHIFSLILQELKDTPQLEAPPTNDSSSLLPYDPSVPVGESHWDHC